MSKIFKTPQIKSPIFANVIKPFTFNEREEVGELRKKTAATKIFHRQKKINKPLAAGSRSVWTFGTTFKIETPSIKNK